MTGAPQAVQNFIPLLSTAPHREQFISFSFERKKQRLKSTLFRSLHQTGRSVTH